jgi:alanyl-tRNA synthetase
VWTGDGPPSGTPGTDGRWLELWNHVTMRYERHTDGSLTPLAEPAVDTGMGLERLLMASQRAPSVFATDVFAPWRPALLPLWQPGPRSLRILADHLRSAIVVIADGVRPSSSGRGYVLRRLLRRALMALWHGDGASTLTLGDLPPGLVQHTASQFGQVIEPSLVTGVLTAEERKFRELVRRARPLVRRLHPSGTLTEQDYEFLRDTHGLPRELVTGLLNEPEPG